MEQLSENLSLFEVNKQLLQEMKTLNAQTLQSLQQQDEIKLELQKLVYLTNAFTSAGTPLRSYLPDHFLAAYLALVGPALGQRISDEQHDPNEVTKACIIIAKQILDEINSYQSSVAPGQEAIKNALQFSEDPWNGEENQATED